MRRIVWGCIGHGGWRWNCRGPALVGGVSVTTRPDTLFGARSSLRPSRQGDSVRPASGEVDYPFRVVNDPHEVAPSQLLAW